MAVDKRSSDRGLTLEGTEQLMVLLSKSTDAGTSTPCPEKRHLRLFWACTEQPSHVVLTITVSVAISSGQTCFALSCFHSSSQYVLSALPNTGMHGAGSTLHSTGGDWRGSGHRADGQVGSETILVLSPNGSFSRRFRHYFALFLNYKGQLRCGCIHTWRMQTCKSHRRPYSLPAYTTQGVRRWHAPG